MIPYDYPPINSQMSSDELIKFLFKTVEKLNYNQVLLQKEIDELKGQTNGIKK